MKKQIMIALGLAMAPALAMAADFSGAWVRDASKSDTVGYPLYWITRDLPAGGGGGQGGQQVVTVEQTATNLKVVDQARPVRNYPLDGRAHDVTLDTGIAKASLTAGVQGETIVISSVQPWGSMPGNVSTTFKDTWSLSPDGKVLTITSVRTSPADGAKTTRQTYTKR